MRRKKLEPAFTYLRTSSAANVGADRDSDKRQREAIQGFARYTGYELVGEFYDAIVSARLPSSFVQPFGAGDILMPALVFVALCSLPVTTSRATAVVVMNGDEELVTVARRRAHLEDSGSALLGGPVIPVGNAALGLRHEHMPGSSPHSRCRHRSSWSVSLSWWW